MKSLDVKMKSIDELVPYENNPRINGLAVSVIADSIREFGFKNPIIVDEHNVIIAGHTRLLAGKQLGLEEVPVIVADDLTPQQVKAFRIMDNRSSEFAEWDYLKLLGEVKELEEEEYNIDLTGFDEIELANIVEELEGKQKESDKDKGEIEFTDELLEEHQYIVVYFDNAMDWNVIQDKLGIKQVQALRSKEGYRRTGLGRVVHGRKLLEMLESDEDGTEEF